MQMLQWLVPSKTRLKLMNDYQYLDQHFLRVCQMIYFFFFNIIVGMLCFHEENCMGKQSQGPFKKFI